MKKDKYEMSEWEKKHYKQLTIMEALAELQKKTGGGAKPPKESKTNNNYGVIL